MSKTQVSYNVGPGFLWLLGLLFIALKLTGYINWSWWLVLLPLYGPAVIVILFLFMVFMFATIITAISVLHNK